MRDTETRKHSNSISESPLTLALAPAKVSRNKGVPGVCEKPGNTLRCKGPCCGTTIWSAPPIPETSARALTKYSRRSTLPRRRRSSSPGGLVRRKKKEGARGRRKSSLVVAQEGARKRR
ncbi:hypothetical protein LSTR_LSTR016500 [Laodelphax striatellus]|uniref:Uncharacterized protein n=1 Tax=Laodelphax striatellus TaxID=195883 RepID=A0A482XBW2_LAOST|nr:hypothetical protein LSTR_LSTR016500 [Laodelphax striatellus]